jgi:uncharacterized protein YndB with AHSA1/START domain
VTIRAQVELPIARSVESVWDELTAIERYPEWLVASGVTAVQRADGPLGAGTPLRISQRVAGQGGVLDGVVDDWELLRRFGFRARHPDGITIQVLAELAPEPPLTWVRWTLEVGLPLRLRLFESMAASEVRRAANADLLGFKRRLEQVAT